MGKTKKEQSLKINNFFKTLQPSQVKTAAKNSKVPKTTTKASYVKDLQDRIAKGNFILQIARNKVSANNRTNK